MVLLHLFDESQTRLADFGYIPECKSKNPSGLNEISLPLARMQSTSSRHCTDVDITLFRHCVPVTLASTSVSGGIYWRCLHGDSRNRRK